MVNILGRTDERQGSHPPPTGASLLVLSHKESDALLTDGCCTGGPGRPSRRSHPAALALEYEIVISGSLNAMLSLLTAQD